MKLLIILLILISSTLAHAFTLNNNFGGAFKKDRVKVLVADNTTCDPSMSGLTVYELEQLIKPAVNNFWNKVPTSSLRLLPGGFSGNISNINGGRLCAPTDDECIDAAPPGTLIPPVNEIIIACNNNPVNFSNSANVLAVTVPNNFSGSKISGAVILINDSSTIFSTLSQSDKISVLAHEIGHAIGLGHAENKNNEALMYYKTVNLRRSLAQDDIDGVSYLYPVKVDGCGLFGGTITAGPKGPPFWQMGAILLMLILLSEMMRLLRRPKACTPL
jgi:hypothetical protein